LHLSRHAAQAAHGADTLTELFKKGGFGIGLVGHVACVLAEDFRKDNSGCD
jgi:hypothetical protein